MEQRRRESAEKGENQSVSNQDRRYLHASKASNNGKTRDGGTN